MNIKSQSLGNVVLPLVRVMTDAALSWAEREKLSEAIAVCHRQWEEMERERLNTLNQQNVGNAQSAGNAAPGNLGQASGRNY